MNGKGKDIQFNRAGKILLSLASTAPIVEWSKIFQLLLRLSIQFQLSAVTEHLVALFSQRKNCRCKVFYWRAQKLVGREDVNMANEMVTRVCLQRVIRWLSLIKGFFLRCRNFSRFSLCTARASNIITSANIVFLRPMADAQASKLMKEKQLSLWLRQGHVASVLYIKLIRNPESWGFAGCSWFIWPHFIDEAGAVSSYERGALGNQANHSHFRHLKIHQFCVAIPVDSLSSKLRCGHELMYCRRVTLQISTFKPIVYGEIQSEAERKDWYPEFGRRRTLESLSAAFVGD